MFIKNIKITALVVVLISISCNPAYTKQKDLTNSVVKVFVTANKMDYYHPWQSQGTFTASGSGCILPGNRILTNAHVVAENTFIQVKKNADPKKYTAKVDYIGHDCDLAVLTVNDPKFFEGTTSLELGELPKLQENVSVLGYPQGGGKLSITKGVVSRVELVSYAQSFRKLLAVQIDAAINPGNSGGPVIKDDKLVGIAMQAYKSAQNIGYMIPPPIIKHFLNDMNDGSYDGFPMLGIEFNNTENLAMKKYFNIDDDEGGVLVTKVLPRTSSYNILKEGDIILEIENTEIGEDGTYKFRNNERLSMANLINDKQLNDKISVKIKRNGENKNFSISLNPYTPLVPFPHHFKKPPYYLYAGFLFMPLSADLLHTYGNRWWEQAPVDMNYFMIASGRMNTDNKDEIVVVLSVLSDDINVGYQHVNNDIVVSVNGEKIKSFKQFVKTINKLKNSDDFTKILLKNNANLIIDNTNIDQIDKEILKRNNIPFQYSKDVAGWIEKGE